MYKQCLAHDVLLTYLDYPLPFEIYTDQRNMHIAFFSRKLIETQHKYSIMGLELLLII